jgi:hypothetical protein
MDAIAVDRRLSIREDRMLRRRRIRKFEGPT